MTEGISLNMSCPSCGGAVTSLEGQRTIACPYCQSLLHVEGDRGVFTVMFRNNLDVVKARETMKTWFAKGLKARDLPEQATITEVYPIYVPYWRLVARAAGWVCGYREERYTDRNGNTHTRRVPMERMVFRDFEWSEIACDPGDIGVNRLPSTQGQAVSHEEGGIPTFESTTSPDDAREKGMHEVRQLAVASANVPNITFSKVHVVPKYLGQTFYPIWVARYLYRGRTYFATLDGVRGMALSGRAPGDPLYQSLALVGGSAVGGTMAGAAVSSIGMHGSWELTVVGAIIGIAIFVVSYMFFRHGSEVTEGDIEKPYRKSLKGLGFKFMDPTELRRGL